MCVVPPWGYDSQHVVSRMEVRSAKAVWSAVREEHGPDIVRPIGQSKQTTPGQVRRKTYDCHGSAPQWSADNHVGEPHALILNSAVE